MEQYINERLIEACAEAEWLDEWLFAATGADMLPMSWMSYLDAASAFYAAGELWNERY